MRRGKCLQYSISESQLQATCLSRARFLRYSLQILNCCHPVSIRVDFYSILLQILNCGHYFWGSVDFYDFHCLFSIKATTYIIDSNEFDINFIITLLSKLIKKSKLQTQYYHKKKQHYNWDIIYKFEIPAYSSSSGSKFCYRLHTVDCSSGLPLEIIFEQIIQLTDGSIGPYSLYSLLHHPVIYPVYPQS